MATINTKDDLMRLLKEDAELKDLLREMVSESISEVQKETVKVQRDILAEMRAMRTDISHLVGDGKRIKR